MNISINKKELTKSLFGIVLLSVGITIYYQSLYGMLLIGDSLFLSGLFFLCIALFRIVRHLGLFDSMIYGTKKLFSKTEQDFFEYIEDNPYQKRVMEVLMVAIASMGTSFLF